MTAFWIISAAVFLLTTFWLMELSSKYYKQESGTRLWKIWGLRTTYFEGIVVVSGLITSGVMIFVAKSGSLPV